VRRQQRKRDAARASLRHAAESKLREGRKKTSGSALDFASHKPICADLRGSTTAARGLGRCHARTAGNKKPAPSPTRVGIRRVVDV